MSNRFSKKIKILIPSNINVLCRKDDLQRRYIVLQKAKSMDLDTYIHRFGLVAGSNAIQIKGIFYMTTLMKNPATVNSLEITQADYISPANEDIYRSYNKCEKFNMIFV